MEYSRFISGFSEIFKNIALKNIFSFKLEEEVKKIPKTRKMLLRYLSRLRYGELILFLGAGLSASLNAPTWDQLLENLMYEAIRKKGPDIGIKQWEEHKLQYLSQQIHRHERNHPIFEAELIKAELKDQLERHIKSILKFKNPKSSELLDSVKNLIINNKIEEVTTYNYDDLLENCLSKEPKTLRSIHIEPNNSSSTHKILPIKRSGLINIVHVHGFISNINPQIIFAESDYLHLLSEPNDWRNEFQLRQLRNSKCLLIGLSIQDLNLRNLMRRSFKFIVNNDIKPHFVFLRRQPIEEFLDKSHKQKYMYKKSTIKVLHGYHRLKETIYAELGLNVIWYNEHEDLPYEILKCCHTTIFRGAKIIKVERKVLSEIERKNKINFSVFNRVNDSTKMGFAVRGNRVLGIGCYNSKLIEIPESIHFLLFIEELYLKDNHLLEIPSEITHLKRLKILDLSNNFLSEIPESIGKLSSLERLILSYNNLTKLPRSITNLKALKVLDLRENSNLKIPNFLRILKNKGVKILR